LVSGVEVFDESEANVSRSDALSLIMTEKRHQFRVDYEKEHGLPPVLPVFLGDEFYKL
jgi:hypothetical protein